MLEWPARSNRRRPACHHTVGQARASIGVVNHYWYAQAARRNANGQAHKPPLGKDHVWPPAQHQPEALTYASQDLEDITYISQDNTWHKQLAHHTEVLVASELARSNCPYLHWHRSVLHEPARLASEGLIADEGHLHIGLEGCDFINDGDDRRNVPARSTADCQ